MPEVEGQVLDVDKAGIIWHGDGLRAVEHGY